MRSSRHARALLVASLAASIACPLVARAEETILFFERHSRTTSIRPASQGGNAVTDTSRADIVITLGDRRAALYEPGQVWVYDFERRRVLNVNSSRRQYSDWSLHAFVAFAEDEMRNRLAMRAQMMRSRGGQGPSVLELETLFSMSALPIRPGDRESLVDSSRADLLRFYVNRVPAVEVVPSDTAFAPGRASVFGRLLALQAHMHPRARAAMVRSGRVPRRLTYRYRDFNEETIVELRLIRLSSAPEANNPIAGMQQVDVADPAYAELNGRLAALRRCAGHDDWIEASRRFEAAARDSGRWLDAELARDERAIGACEAVTSWPAPMDAKVVGDTAIAACRSGLAWRDSAGAIAALLQLDRVNGRGLAKGYVLDLLRARARLAAGDFNLGAYLMMGGLGGNPCMSGAWLDLAHGYLRSYQPVLGWLCLEAAERAGGPSCRGRLDERAALERGLEQRHPDFFE